MANPNVNPNSPFTLLMKKKEEEHLKVVPSVASTQASKSKLPQTKLQMKPS